MLNPIITKYFNERAQADLINMSSMPIRSFKYIFVYQDHLTKFCLLMPLRTKRARAVYLCLLKAITTLGCPMILQTDNGTEFSFNEKLRKIWPKLKIIKSRARHPQSQGSVERANGDISDLIRCWLEENNSTDWVKALPFIQLQKNSAVNRTIKCSPYRAVFGQDPHPLNLLTPAGPAPSALPPPPPMATQTPSTSYDLPEEELFNDTTPQSEDDDLYLFLSDDDQEPPPIPTTVEVDPVVSSSSSSSSPPPHLPCSSPDNDKTSQVAASSSEDVIQQPQQQQQQQQSKQVSSSATATHIVQIDNIRRKASAGLQDAAEKSKTNNKIAQDILPTGTIVAVRIPSVDQTKLSFRNILLCVFRYCSDISKYQLCTIDKSVLIDGYFDGREFISVCSTNVNIQLHQNPSRTLSLRSIVRLENYKYVGCKCTGRCQSKSCFCRRVGKVCDENLCQHSHSTLCLNSGVKDTAVETRNKRKRRCFLSFLFFPDGILHPDTSEKDSIFECSLLVHRFHLEGSLDTTE